MQILTAILLDDDNLGDDDGEPEGNCLAPNDEFIGKDIERRDGCGDEERGQHGNGKKESVSQCSLMFVHIC